jgi:hypothetical protein
MKDQHDKEAKDDGAGEPHLVRQETELAIDVELLEHFWHRCEDRQPMMYCQPIVYAHSNQKQNKVPLWDCRQTLFTNLCHYDTRSTVGSNTRAWHCWLVCKFPQPSKNSTLNTTFKLDSDAICVW